ncbi:MAG: hypothetical protein INR66_21490, partial [Gordonia polyisoprenivorans]|nr:hypothetical protein [Gordonia polyisoprenivorans]
MATNSTWGGSTGNWNTGSSWTNNTPPSNDGTAIASSGTISVTNVDYVGGLSLSGTGGIKIDGGSLFASTVGNNGTYNLSLGGAGVIVGGNIGFFGIENYFTGTASGNVYIEGNGSEFQWLPLQSNYPGTATPANSSGLAVTFKDHGSNGKFTLGASFNGTVSGFSQGDSIIWSDSNALNDKNETYTATYDTNSITLTDKENASITIRFSGATYNASNLIVDGSTIKTNYVSPSPTFASASYDASTGKLVITGSGFTSSVGDYDPTQLQFTGQDGQTYNLTAGTVSNAGSGGVTVTLTAADQLAVDGLFNANGHSSTGNDIFNQGIGPTNYKVSAGGGFDGGASNSSTGMDGVTVSNARVPTITGVIYDSTTGVLTINGSGFENQGTYGGLNLGQITLTGQGGSNQAFTFNAGDYGPAVSSTQIVVDLSKPSTTDALTVMSGEKASVDALFDQGGTASQDGTTYNFAATSGWDSGAGAAITTQGVTVIGPAGTPSANSQSVTTDQAIAKAITLTGSDPDTPPLGLSYTVTTAPAHGTLTGTTPNLTYTPTPGYSGTDSFTFTDNNGSNTSTPATVTITVTPAPTVSVNDVTKAEGNSGTSTLTFTISLSNASGQNVSLNYATADETATTADGDYVATSGTLTFSPGETSKTVNVTVNGDTKFEPNETFNLNLSSLSYGTFAGNQGIGTITNDDTPPTLSVNDVSHNEGNSGTTAYAFTVSLNAASGQATTVNYATANGTALAGPDYTATSGTLSFAAGETSKTITVLVNGDQTVEPNETFALNLSNPTNATFSVGQGIGTIVNDDESPMVTSIKATGALTNNASSDEFAVTFSKPVTGVSSSDFTITTTDAPGGTALTTGGITSITEDGTTYTVVVGGVAGDGTLRLDLKAVAPGIMDQAGNPVVAAFTTGDTYTVDHTAPSLTASESVSGPTSATSDTISGTVSDANGVVSVHVFDGDTDLGAVTVSDGSYSLTASGLSEGPHSFSVQATDSVGNVATTSAGSVTVDTTAPGTPAAPVLANDTGASSSDGITRDATIVYATPAPGDTLLYSTDGTTYSTTAPSFAVDGTYMVSTEERDAVGNTSGPSSLTFTLDTAAPSASSTSKTVDPNSGASAIGLSAPSDN